MYVPSIINMTYVPEDIKNYISKDCDTINLYFDLKNVSTGLFVEDIVSQIVENNNNLSVGVDSSIFQNIITTIVNWSNFLKSNSYKYNIIFTNDVGKSSYHKKILPEYKDNRKISNLTMVQLKEDLDKIKANNWELSEKICNNFNNVYFINLSYLESDFLSYYLITRHFNSDNMFNIILSCDKDHFQTLNLKNTLMIYRKGGEYNYINKDNYMNKYVKLGNTPTDISYKQLLYEFDKSYITIMMSVIGDASDGIKGVNGVSGKTAIKLFSNVELIKKLFGSYDDVFNRVKNENKLIDDSAVPMSRLENQWQKAITCNDTLANNFKLIDYEYLVKWLEEKNHTFKIDMLNKIDSVINRPVADFETNVYSEFTSFLSKLEDYSLHNLDLKILFE